MSGTLHSRIIQNDDKSLELGFWELGQYKANIQRIKAGSEQLDQLTELIRERIEIESKYGSKLSQWNQRWNNYTGQMMPNGVLKKTLNKITEEAHELAQSHLSSKDRLSEEILKTIDLYKKNNYHLTTFSGFKEAKEISDEFDKAQRQWKKFYDKVELSKRKYHEAARAQKSAHIQMDNSHSDPAIFINGIPEKYKERYARTTEELLKTKNEYEKNIGEITKYNNVYKETMGFVFEKCQQMELKRMLFYMEMLSGMQKILVELINPPKLIQLHTYLEQQIFSSNLESQFESDLKDWSRKHGVDVPLVCPSFEECSIQFRNITNAAPKNQDDKYNQGIILRKKIIKSDDVRSNDLYIPLVTNQPTNFAKNYSNVEPIVSNKKIMKVIYDYVAAESDEISLIKGENIDVIRDTDDAGWCYGTNTKNETGLFPASYVSTLGIG